MKRRYFVSYTYWRPNSEVTGVACCQIERDRPICQFSDVREIMDKIQRDNGFDLVVIQGWQPFEEQPCS